MALPLFINNVGYNDFYNNVWLVTNYIDYFKNNFTFPLIINNNEMVGDALPLFYGGPLHSIAAMLGMLIGPFYGLKVVLGLILFTLIISVYNLLNKVRIFPENINIIIESNKLYVPP